MNPFEGWLTPAQAARQLNITPNWVRMLLKQDRLRYHSTPLGRLIDPQAVAQFATERASRKSSTPELVSMEKSR